MIAPRPRLIFWTGLLALSLSALAALGSVSSALAGGVLGVFMLFAALDGFFSRKRLDPVDAGLPEVARFTRNRPGEILVALENKGAAARALRIGLALPVEMAPPAGEGTGPTPREEASVIVPGHTSVHVGWPCTALRRGNFTLDNVYLETPSGLGLWNLRKTAPAHTEIRVYPNTLPEQKHLAAIFLNRGLFGVHARRQIGKGKEFERLRDYLPGDSYEDVHWKATAKRGRPITKVYQIERTQEVYVVIDASRLSARLIGGSDSSAPVSQLERFITTAMVLGLVAEKQGDLFGVLAFDDQVRRFIRAKNGKEHYGLCREALYALEPRRVNPDFGELSSFIRLRLRRRALLMFLTNLDDPVIAENLVRNLEVLSSHHLVLVNMLKLPGVAPLFSDPDVEAADDLYRQLAGHIQWRRLRELERVLGRRGVTLSLLDNEVMCPQFVSQYINVKRRQIL